MQEKGAQLISTTHEARTFESDFTTTSEKIDSMQIIQFWAVEMNSKLTGVTIILI